MATVCRRAVFRRTEDGGQPTVNRSHKRDRDASEWLPDLNECWFANRVVEVRQQYGLTVDRRERDVLESILSSCRSTAMVVTRGARPTPTRLHQRAGAGASTLSGCTTATATDASPAQRRVNTASLPFTGDILRTPTWTTGTAMASSASERHV